MAETTKKTVEIEVKGKDSTGPLKTAAATAKKELGSLQKLKEGLGEQSTLGGLGKIAMGGGAVAGLGLLGRVAGDTAEKVLELKKELGSLGDVGGAELAQKLGSALPVIGEFFKAGATIREIVLGEQAAIDDMGNSAAAFNAIVDARRKMLTNTNEELTRQAGVLRDIGRELELMGLPPGERAAKVIEQGTQKAIEEEKKKSAANRQKIIDAEKSAKAAEDQRLKELNARQAELDSPLNLILESAGVGMQSNRGQIEKDIDIERAAIAARRKGRAKQIEAELAKVDAGERAVVAALAGKGLTELGKQGTEDAREARNRIAIERERERVRDLEILRDEAGASGNYRGAATADLALERAKLEAQRRDLQRGLEKDLLGIHPDNRESRERAIGEAAREDAALVARSQLQTVGPAFVRSLIQEGAGARVAGMTAGVLGNVSGAFGGGAGGTSEIGTHDKKLAALHEQLISRLERILTRPQQAF